MEPTLFRSQKMTLILDTTSKVIPDYMEGAFNAFNEFKKLKADAVFCIDKTNLIVLIKDNKTYIYGKIGYKPYKIYTIDEWKEAYRLGYGFYFVW